jgi:hypothetical protein
VTDSFSYPYIYSVSEQVLDHSLLQVFEPEKIKIQEGNTSEF